MDLYYPGLLQVEFGIRIGKSHIHGFKGFKPIKIQQHTTTLIVTWFAVSSQAC
jgi:hypothetical protein